MDESDRETVPAFAALPQDAARLMRVFVRHSEPIGARVAAQEVREIGPSVSEATVSRLLIKLDEAGYTRPVGRKGRVATAAGRSAAEAALRDERTSAQLQDALDIREVGQLLDLLHARRGVECESVLLAAERATEDDLRALRENVDAYSAAVSAGRNASVPGNDFHRLLIRAAHSPLLETVSDLILRDRLDALEPVLLVITSGHGSLGAAPTEHTAILNALEAHDGGRAQAVLDEHLTRLITEVEDFAARGDQGILARLLQLVR